MISDTTVRFWGDCRAAILPATLLRNTALRNAPHLRMDWRSMLHFIETIGAGEGNRTLVISLEGCCSTIELLPRQESVRMVSDRSVRATLMTDH
jgi:hypothetical protein